MMSQGGRALVPSWKAVSSRCGSNPLTSLVRKLTVACDCAIPSHGV